MLLRPVEKNKIGYKKQPPNLNNQDMETNTKREKSGSTIEEIKAKLDQKGIQMDLSWMKIKERLRSEYGEGFFQNRTIEEMTEEYLTECAFHEMTSKENEIISNENMMLKARIKSLTAEVKQLRELNEAYGISLDRFFKSRSVACLKRT